MNLNRIMMHSSKREPAHSNSNVIQCDKHLKHSLEVADAEDSGVRVAGLGLGCDGPCISYPDLASLYGYKEHVQEKTNLLFPRLLWDAPLHGS